LCIRERERKEVSEPSDEWLEKINAKFSAEGTPHRQRPWLAWKQWAVESGQTLGLSDPLVKRIFAWFKENTKEGSQLIGNLYLGALYHDAEMWPVVLRPFYGSAELRPLEALPSMPDRIKQRLAANAGAMRDLMSAWTDCLELGLRAENVRDDPTLGTFTRQLLTSGGETLSAAGELLLLRNPNPKALGNARMATEIYLKAFLAAKNGQTDETAKKDYSHSLRKLMRRVLEISPGSEFAAIEPRLVIFPPNEEKYESNPWPTHTLWEGYSTALHTAATVLRLLTGEDVRKAMW
jgi:hypothetical protein